MDIVSDITKVDRLGYFFKYLNLSNFIFWIGLLALVHFIWTKNIQKKYGLIWSLVFLAAYYGIFTIIKNTIQNSNKNSNKK